MPGAAPSPPLPSAPSTPAAAVAPPVRPAPAPTPPGAKPVAPRKDFFALDAAALLDAASKSEAVSKVDPFADRKAHASSEEVAAAEAKAEAALLANKKKERTRTPDEAAAQLKSTAAVYTPPEENLVLEQYYGDFVLDGYEPIDVRREQISLRPIDPREIELSKLADTNKSVSVGVPEGLAFLDDFPLLYIKKIVPPPSDEVVIDATDPNLLIPGKRKVTVHLLNGEKRQGAIRSLRRGDLGFKLEPLGSGQTEEMSISQVKAVFIHLQPNASPKDGTGRELTATFTDGRAVQGLSDDYQPGEPVFTLVPPAGRGQFERIIVNAAAVRSVV